MGKNRKNRHKSWQDAENQIIEKRQQAEHTRRRVEFVPAKNIAKNGLSERNSAFSTTGSSHISSEKAASNSKVTSNSVIGLFNPVIVTKYLVWKSISKVGPGFYNDGNPQLLFEIVYVKPYDLQGNTCYLNSTLQCLLYTPALSQVLLFETETAMKGLKFRTNADRNNDQRGYENNKPVVAHFQHLVESVWSVPHSKPISPRGLISSIKRVGKQFKPFRQEDAHEYLRQLLDCMHEEVLKANQVRTSDGKIAETSFISRIFGGYLCNTMRCPKCGNTSKTFNHFQDLSLDISGRIDSIQSAIEAFTKPEFLTAGNEWNCDRCKQKVKVRDFN